MPVPIPSHVPVCAKCVEQFKLQDEALRNLRKQADRGITDKVAQFFVGACMMESGISALAAGLVTVVAMGETTAKTNRKNAKTLIISVLDAALQANALYLSCFTDATVEKCIIGLTHDRALGEPADNDTGPGNMFG